MGLFPFPGEKNLWRPSQRPAPITGKGTQFGQVSPKYVLNVLSVYYKNYLKSMQHTCVLLCNLLQSLSLCWVFLLTNRHR